MQTQAEYERNELNKALAEEMRVEKAPLADRQAARAAFKEAMELDPEAFAVTVRWMLDGNYGFGVRGRIVDYLKRDKSAKRRRIILTQWAAVYEWNCPARFATQAWKSLTKEQQDTVDAAVDAEIAAFLNEQGGGL